MASESDDAIAASDNAFELHDAAEFAPRKRSSSVGSGDSAASTRTCLSDDDQLEQNFKDRGVWSSKFDFFFSCLGYCIGIGNFVRFPGLVFKNGGGAFFVPYILMLILSVVPIVYLEMIIGQFSSASTLKFGRIIPLFQGIGWAMFIVTFFTIVYYQIVVAWVVYYLFVSMSSVLPFANCNNTWNTPACKMVSQWNSSAYERQAILSDSGGNGTGNARTSSEEFFRIYVLDESGDISTLGTINWHLALSLLFSWACIFIVLFQSVTSHKKVVYVTVVVPWTLMIVFLIATAYLPGSDIGFRYFLSPNWDKIAQASTWVDASSQAFYSLGPCFGGIMTLSSYNKFKYDIQRDAIMLAILGTVTSFLAGLVVFGSLGVLSEKTGIPMTNLDASGSGLTFIAYPDLIALLPGAPVWSVLFFLMLLLLGFDSQLTMSESIVTSVHDLLPAHLRGNKRSRLVIFSCLCGIGILVGMLFTCQAGVYWYELLNTYAADWNLLIIAMCLCVSTMYFYGWRRIAVDVQFMSGRRPTLFWFSSWFASPFLLMAILIYSWAQPAPLTYGTYVYPTWSTVLGNVIAMVPISAIVIGCIAALVQKKLDFKALSHPEEHWGATLASAFYWLDKTVPDYISGDPRPPADAPSVGTVGGWENPTFVGSDDAMEAANHRWDSRGAETAATVVTNGGSGGGGLAAANGLAAVAAAAAAAAAANQDETRSTDSDNDNNWHTWRGKYDFFTSCMAFTIGLGNVWRFPVLCFKYGGGAFFVPYLIMMIVCGIPIYFLELILGQYFREGFYRVWKIVPISRGIGIASFITLFYLALYYSVMGGLCLYYFFASLTTELPWAKCGYSFNSPNCTLNANITAGPGSVSNFTDAAAAAAAAGNGSAGVNYMVASMEYLKFGVLRLSPDGADFNGINWYLWVCCVLMWILIALALCRGIESAGKTFERPINLASMVVNKMHLLMRAVLAMLCSVLICRFTLKKQSLTCSKNPNDVNQE